MIRELKTFVAIAQAGTFAAAGRDVGLTQAAVSAQMKRLEEALGLALFARSGRNVLLTAQGQDVLDQAQTLLSLYGALGATASPPDATSRLTLGAIASIQRSLLPDRLAEFHRQHSQCQTRVVPGVSLELLNQVDSGELDMAIIIRPPFALHSDLRWSALAHEPFRLIAPSGLGDTQWQHLIATQPFIRYDRTSFGGRQVDRFLRQHHCRVQEVCEVDELDAIVKLVANGVGVALIPESETLKAWPAAVRVIDLEEHTFHRDVGLIHRPLSQLPPPARALAQRLAG